MNKEELSKLEYASLRQEILESINAIDNYKIAMYTITVAILCAALELKTTYLLLLPYVIIFAFQSAISTKNENNIVMGAYLAVYHEKNDGWETNNILQRRRLYQKAKVPTKKNYLLKSIKGVISSVQLGAICSVLCIVFSIIEIVGNGKEFIPKDLPPVVCILLSVVLFAVLQDMTKDVLKLGERKAKYIAILTEERNSLAERVL